MLEDFLLTNLFSWITVARRPQKIEELSAILAVKPAVTQVSGFARNRRTNKAENTIRNVCGHIISIASRGPHHYLYPMHYEEVLSFCLYIPMNRETQQLRKPLK